MEQRRVNNDRASQQRAGILGVAIGLLVALCAVGAGLYFGLIKPALDSGADVVVPVRFIVVSVVTLILVAVFGIHRVFKWGRAPPNDRW
jgi:hypothetical protein